MKVKRIKLGLIYDYDLAGWAGGAYYIHNLVMTLKLLPINERPHIYFVIFNYKLIEEIKSYEYEPSNILKINFFIKTLFRLNNIFKKFKLGFFKIKIWPFDVIFPLFGQFDLFEDAHEKIYWIPDFQDLAYPNFFSEKEKKQRTQSRSILFNIKNKILLSSESMMKELLMYYPNASASLHIFNFCVHLPEAYLQETEIKSKYKIDANYFIVCNQFWKHKNHEIIINALRKLTLTSNENIKIVFTGKTDDRRDPNFYKTLINRIDKYGLSDRIIITGFIPKIDQLSLLKHSIAMIQPSLYEGWNVSVEEAKAMNKFIIASDIPVHREQIKTGAFFKPDNSDELAEIIKFPEKIMQIESNSSYMTEQRISVGQFKKIIESLHPRK